MTQKRRSPTNAVRSISQRNVPAVVRGDISQSDSPQQPPTEVI